MRSFLGLQTMLFLCCSSFNLLDDNSGFAWDNDDDDDDCTLPLTIDDTVADVAVTDAEKLD